MQAASGYLRVSTREQGRRGWGLAAQRFEIEASQTGFPTARASSLRKLQLPHHRLEPRLLSQRVHERIGLQQN